MSLWRDDPKPAPATLAALAVVALIAVGSLGRLFVGARYIGWALAGVTIGAAFALWFGRRSLGVGFGLLLVGWVLSLPGLFARVDSAGGFPTQTSLRAAFRLIRDGLAAVPRSVPPLEPEPRFMVLVWSALLFLGFLGAAWVVVRRPVGAIISALGVVTFAGSLGEGPGRTAYAVAAVAATGAFFLFEGRQRIERWASGRIRVPLWFGIPTLGVASALALAAPFVIGESPLVELRSALRPRLVIIKPLSDIRRQLKVDPPIEVMRVTSERATYWRLTALDDYNGTEWVLEARPRPVRRGELGAATPPTTGEFLDQRYRLTSLLSPWMPAAYAARSVETQASFDLDEKSQTLLLRDRTSPGLSYSVRSQLPNVAVNLPEDPGRVSDGVERFFGNVARPVVAGATTPLDIARRLEAHFRGYTYNEDADGGHSVGRLQRFLQERTGYCEQFAATMTLMLRGLGIDARVGVGFLPGAGSGGEFVVSTREAHAWVEADVPGAGWSVFDPTPGRGENPPAASETTQSEPATPPPAPEETTVPAATPETQNFPEDVGESGGGIPAAVLWPIVAMAALVAIPVSKRIRRQIRQVGEPPEVILGAFAELTDRGRELGWSLRASETHREFFRRAVGEATTPALAGLSARAVYGPPSATREEATAAWAALGPALRAMRKRASWWRLATASIDPRSLLPTRMLGRARTRLAAFGRG